MDRFSRITGCMAALQAEHYLVAHDILTDRVPERAIAEDDVSTAKVVQASEHLAAQAVVTANGIAADGTKPVPT